MTYRPDIDGLRGLAVLAVVVFHAWPSALPYGFLGVDVFFVISGYLITSDIVRRIEAGTFTLADFYMRRVRRLFPALVTVLAAVSAFGAIVLYPDEREQLAQHVLASALFAQNFQLISEAGYFDTASGAKPLLHLWSLAVEEQFYLLWPLLMVVRPRVWVVALLALASLGAFLLLPLDLAYYLPVTRFFEILLGALMALAWRFPVVPTTRWLVYVGKISYPLYLWHWPVLVFLRLLVPDAGVMETSGAVALSFVLAAATYRWIEQPIRTTGVLRQRFRGLAGASVAVVALASCLPLLPATPDQRLADLTDKPDRERLLKCSLPDGLCLQTVDNPTHALVGDSHADHLFDALEGGWLLSYRQSCPPLLGQNVIVGRTQCRSESTIAAISSLPVKTVVLSFFGQYGETTNYAADHEGIGPASIRIEGPGGDKSERVRAGLDASVGALLAAGKDVVLLIDVPELPFRPRDCITRPLQIARPCVLDRTEVLKRQASMRAIVHDVQTRHPTLRVFDPLVAICNPRCEIDRGDMLLYKDSHHLSVRGSRLVAKAFASHLHASVFLNAHPRRHINHLLLTKME